MRPGEIIPGDEDIPLNPGRERRTVHVANISDRAVQVGSHYHFAAVNPELRIDGGDRERAWGHRLDIPAGTAVRFEPGHDDDVDLVPIEGDRIVRGLRVEYAGELDEGYREPPEPVYGRKGEGPLR
ncbi:urease subunit beta [Actinomadura macrotermitis]|uniref:Urease subunit beta 1 n=1 Tax=Actinomadura macrotermitis TaxID=2585200 RepID=A0A7K0BQR3_9ACTN|nr:urease subunit beta [Actinomadura macrotermitis]MQY03528.1 Urease subunit beta 1 [Actinomadura macrotermitis]